MARASLRVLERFDLEAAKALCDRDPVANVFVASRLASHGIARTGAGELWGYFDGGELTSLCWAGANVIPVEATLDAVEAFAARARRSPRQCSSIVGPAEVVLPLWQLLAPSWGGAREVRDDQPVMAITGAPRLSADPEVRVSSPREIDLLLPACVAMFTEEVGYSPVSADGGHLYRDQVRSLVASRRSLVRIGPGPDGEPQVMFKAELGSVSRKAVQVQGVWVNPELRGRGLSEPGMAAVVDYCRAQFAPTTSLYVNAYNARALRVYAKVGFTQVGTFATVLF